MQDPSGADRQVLVSNNEYVEQLRYDIGQYLYQRIADANKLQCTVWADGILDILGQHNKETVDDLLA